MPPMDEFEPVVPGKPAAPPAPIVIVVVPVRVKVVPVP
jgi:hypothetical protein